MSPQFYVLADGGSRGNPGPAAYGAVVIHVETKLVIAERAGHLGIATNNVAEYSGLIAGLNVVKQVEPLAKIEVRLDSKLVVEQMSGRWKIKHPDMRELAMIANKTLSPSQITYTWVPRELNTLADALCNESLDAVERGLSGEIVRDYPL